MYLDQAYRQIALVSYGNEYLKGAVESEILDRHPLLFDHFPILRDLEHGTLLCGSASHLLEHFKSLGTTKISLHLSSDVIDDLVDSKMFTFFNDEFSFCIAVHFQNNTFKVLVLSEEKPSLQSYDNKDYAIFSNYSNYYDNTEIYTLHAISETSIPNIQKDLMPIDWKSFFKFAQNSLYPNSIAKRYGIHPIPMDNNNCYEGNLFNSQKEEQYPLLPFTIRKNYASNLIKNTAILEKYYASASHCKNEYNDYIQMNDDEKTQFRIATGNLTLLHPIIIKNCANHYQDSGFQNTNYFSGSTLSLNSNHISNLDVQINQNSNVYESLHNQKNLISELDDKEEAPSTSFSIWSVIKFFWYLIWCYCAIWTLTNFVVQWGNIVISTCAVIYAIYKISKR